MPRTEFRTLGLDLTDREIRAVVLDSHDGQPVVVAARSIPIAPGAIELGSVKDAGAVTRALRQLLDPLKIGAGMKTVVGIPPEKTGMRILSIPPCPDEEIPKLVEIELEHQGISLKGGQAQHYLRFRGRSNAPAEELQSIGVMDADVEAVRLMAEAVQGAGLTIQAIEPSHAGMLRSMAWNLPLASATFFLVISPKLTAVTYCIGADIVTTRRVDVGSLALLRLPVSETPDTESMLIETPLPPQPRIDHSLVDRLAIESLQTMEYVQRGNDEEIECVRIVSADPDMGLLAPLLERRFGLPTTFTACPNGIDDPRFSVAYGLAVRNFPGTFDFPRIDLFASQRRHDVDQGAHRNLVGSLCVSALALAIGLLGCFFYDRPIAQLHSQTRKMDARLTEVREKAQVEVAEREQGDVRYDALREGGVPLGPLMDYILRSNDPMVSLKSVSVGKDMKVRIEAETQSEAALARMTQRLQTSPILSGVDLQEFDRAQVKNGGTIDFVVTGLTVNESDIRSAVPTL